MSTTSQAYINGRFVPAGEALVPLQDRGFRYGDGVFETIAVHGGVPYQFDWHRERLAGGLRAIKIPFATDALHEQARSLLHKNALESGILRIQITRGSGSKGYLPDAAQPTLVMETMPLPALPQEPVSLWQSGYAKISPRALPVRYKLCQGLNSTLARMEAAEHHCFDALLLNEQGQLCETSSGTLFWLKDNKLYTPALGCGVLEGSTRAAIMRLTPYKPHEVEADTDALQDAEAVFITNVAWQALGVRQLLPLGITWQSAAIAKRMRGLLAHDQEDYAHAHRAEWK